MALYDQKCEFTSINQTKNFLPADDFHEILFFCYFFEICHPKKFFFRIFLSDLLSQLITPRILRLWKCQKTSKWNLFLFQTIFDEIRFAWKHKNAWKSISRRFSRVFEQVRLLLHWFFCLLYLYFFIFRYRNECWIYLEINSKLHRIVSFCFHFTFGLFFGRQYAYNRALVSVLNYSLGGHGRPSVLLRIVG